MTNQNPTGVKLAWVVVCALVASILPAASSFAEEGVMEEIVVTGSRIKRIDAQDANPLVVIDADEIKNVGYNSFQEVMANLTQNSGGSLDQQQVFGFTPAASAVDLRGVGIGRTLTLIDGKRTPKYPIPAGGTDNFSDTANIPLAAIERIEVLTTGASAIYGSDAMGGVVNIITKEYFNGINLDARYSDTDKGGMETGNINLMVGAGDEDRNILFLVEHESAERLKANQRNNFDNLGSDLAFNGFGSYSSYGISLRTFAGSIVRSLAPEECSERGLQPWDTLPFDLCGFNRSARRDLFPERERTSAMTKWNYALNENVEFYGRLDYTKSTTDRAIEPMPVDDYSFFVGLDENFDADPGFVTALSDRSGETARFEQATAFGGDFAALDDGGYYYTRRMIEFGNRTDEMDVDNYAILTGLRGDFGESWSYDADWSFMRTDFKSTSGGYASASTYFDFLTSGTSGRSSFDIMTDAEVEAATYIPTQDAQGSVNQFSVTLSNPELFQMPAGGVGFAVGAETAREWFYNTSDTESINGNILATGGSSGEGKRDYSALYTEFLFPVLESLEVQVALRYDDYSDFGDNVAPLIGVQWRPIDELMFRANWGETFRAPDMQRVYGDPTAAFSQVTDPVACEFQGGQIGDQDIPACRGEIFVDVAVGPNADLDAETGENWNIGMVFQFAGFDGSIDLWNVEIEDIVNDLSAQTIVNNPETYGNLITRNPLNQEVVSVNATAQNLTFIETQGVDFSLGYGLDTSRAGFWDFRLKGTYMTKWDSQFDELSEVVDVIEDSRVPEWRMNFSTNWTLGQWGATLFINYIDSMNGLNNELYDPATTTRNLRIKSWTTTNLSGYWTNDALRVQVGVNNLANEGPKPDDTDSWPFYPQEYHNGIGRQYYLRVSYTTGN
jgi:iron complex outermembrane receptor protein